MDRNNIKLGDWLSLNGRIGRVMQLGYKAVTLDTISGNYDDLKPIVLTDYQLEQNGWHFIKETVDEDGFTYDKYEYADSGIEIEYYPKDGKTFSVFWCGGETFPDIKYVHQLQHILWVFGINEEFKI